MEDKPESFCSSHWVLNILKISTFNRSPSWSVSGRLLKWSLQKRQEQYKVTAKAHFKRHCQRHSGPKGWVLVSKETSCERILIKFHLHNLDQAPNFKNLTKCGFRISTKNNLHNLNQGSAAKYWLNFSFKISPELQLQNLDQTLSSKFGHKIKFLSRLWAQDLVKILKLKLRRDLEAEV